MRVIMTRRVVSVIVLHLFFLCNDTTSSLAFDGNRKGFLLGFGAGPGYVAANSSSSSRRDESWSSIQTTIKLGHGFTEQFQLYFSAKAFFNRDFSPFLQASPSLGGSYYISASPTAIYLVVGGGVVYFSSFSSSGPYVGPTIHAGLGMEFHRKWTLELNLSGSRVTDVFSEVGDLNIGTASLTFGMVFH